MPNIEFIPLALVDDYDKNSNTHPQAQIENIKALMLYVGWTVPALVRKTGERYGLIAGHGRREAANELQGKPLKMADGTPIPAGCIPVLFADGWTDEQIRAYVIADNQVPRTISVANAMRAVDSCPHKIARAETCRVPVQFVAQPIARPVVTTLCDFRNHHVGRNAVPVLVLDVPS